MERQHTQPSTFTITYTVHHVYRVFLVGTGSASLLRHWETLSLHASTAHPDYGYTTQVFVSSLSQAG